MVVGRSGNDGVVWECIISDCFNARRNDDFFDFSIPEPVIADAFQAFLENDFGKIATPVERTIFNVFNALRNGQLCE